MSQDALAKAREIAAKLSGGIIGSDLGKRKNRWDEDQSGNNPGCSLKKKKIYLPVKENPSVNYLGLLIGPKGLTQKQLQEKTGAKIIIRGMGASKDGGPSNTGHPDDTDQLHVSIEGQEENVENAWKEIEKILYDPEQAVKLKNEQLKHLSSSNLSAPNAESIYAPSSNGDPSNEPYQIELKVPNNMVGLVIGKGGENILRIQLQLGVTTIVAKEHEMLPGETTRSIILKGKPEAVSEAKKRIDNIVNAQIEKNNMLATGGISHVQPKELDNAFVVKLPVPNDKVGIIIGKGGMTVKGIQERTRATVQIPVGPDEDDPQIRTLSIGAETKEAVDAAQMEIFMALQMQQQQAQQAYNASANSVQLVVPDEKVGIIIGKGGVTIKDIQNRLHVRVHIPQAADIGTNPPVRTLSIMGTSEAQSMAKYEIEMIVAGTPVHNASATQYNQWSGMSYYGAQSYGNPYMQNYSATTNPYYPATSAQVNSSSLYNAQYQNYTQETAVTDQQQVPTDPTAYYNDYWLYASYYGETAARQYYGAWSPPEGTPPPEGIVVAPDPNQAVTSNLSSLVSSEETNSANQPDLISESKENNDHETLDNKANEQASVNGKDEIGEKTAESNINGQVTDASAETIVEGQKPITSEAEAAAAWEAYKQQYAEWYEKYGKAAGADPNPPMN